MIEFYDCHTLKAEGFHLRRAKIQIVPLKEKNKKSPEAFKTVVPDDWPEDIFGPPGPFITS